MFESNNLKQQECNHGSYEVDKFTTESARKAPQFIFIDKQYVKDLKIKMKINMATCAYKYNHGIMKVLMVYEIPVRCHYFILHGNTDKRYYLRTACFYFTLF